MDLYAFCKNTKISVKAKWVLMDSNHRSRKTADLQSAPFGHSGKHPFFKSECKGIHFF